MRVDRHQQISWLVNLPRLTYSSTRNNGLIRPYYGKPMVNKPLMLVSQHKRYTLPPPTDPTPACITAGSAVRTTVGTLVSSSKSYHPTTQKSTRKAANLHPIFAGGFFFPVAIGNIEEKTHPTQVVWCIRFLKKWGFIGGKSKHFCDFSFLNLVPLREISYVQLILFSYTTLFSLYIFWLRGYPPFIQWQVASSPMLVGDNNSVGMGISVGDDLRLRSFESGDPYGYGLSAYLRCPWGNLHVNGLCHVLFPGEWLFFEKLPGCQTIFVAAGNYSIWAPHTKAEEMMPLDILGRYKTQSCVCNAKSVPLHLPHYSLNCDPNKLGRATAVREIWYKSV